MLGARPARVREAVAEIGGQHGCADAGIVGLLGPLCGRRRLQALADRGELAVGQFQQARREREAAIQIGGVLLGDRPLVADVVLELRPRVLQDRAHLNRRGLLLALDADQQVPARVAPAALAGGLLTHVAVVEQLHLVGQQVGDGRDVVAQERDHAQADLVGDLRERIGEEPLAVDAAVRLLGERRHALGSRRHAEVVDARVVEQRRHQLEVVVGGGEQARAPLREQRDGVAHRTWRGFRWRGHQIGRKRRRDGGARLRVAVGRHVVGPAGGEQADVGADDRVDGILGPAQLALALRRLHGLAELDPAIVIGDLERRTGLRRATRPGPST